VQEEDLKKGGQAAQQRTCLSICEARKYVHRRRGPEHLTGVLHMRDFGGGRVWHYRGKEGKVKEGKIDTHSKTEVWDIGGHENCKRHNGGYPSNQCTIR